MKTEDLPEYFPIIKMQNSMACFSGKFHFPYIVMQISTAYFDGMIHLIFSSTAFCLPIALAIKNVLRCGKYRLNSTPFLLGNLQSE